MTKKIITILTRAESDILRENLIHHITEGVNGFIVTSHVTINENREVLDEFHKYILEVIEIKKPLPFPQDLWRTTMARKAVALGAEWVIPTDTDEFWHGLSVLDEIQRPFNSVVAHDIRVHLPTPSLKTDSFTRATMPYHKQEKHQYGKTIHRRHPRIIIRACSHHPCNPGRVRNDPPGLHMRHYPIRDWNRFLLKVNTGKKFVNLGGGHFMGSPNRGRWRKLQSEDKLLDWYDNLCLSEQRQELSWWIPNEDSSTPA